MTAILTTISPNQGTFSKFWKRAGTTSPPPSLLTRLVGVSFLYSRKSLDLRHSNTSVFLLMLRTFKEQLSDASRYFQIRNLLRIIFKTFPVFLINHLFLSHRRHKKSKSNSFVFLLKNSQLQISISKLQKLLIEICAFLFNTGTGFVLITLFSVVH